MAGERIREVKEEPERQLGRGREPGHKQSGGLFVPGERLGREPQAGADSRPQSSARAEHKQTGRYAPSAALGSYPQRCGMSLTE